MGSGHIKVKKGTHHLFYMAIHHHTTETVVKSNFCLIDLHRLYSCESESREHALN